MGSDFDYWTASQDGPATQPDGAERVVTRLCAAEPLDDQMGSWPLLSLPDEIKPHLFPSDGQNTFAILDAAMLPGLPEKLEASQLEFRCLYKGKLQKDLRDQAPYIVALAPDDSFTRELFTDGDPDAAWWPRDFGIFVVTRQSLPAAWTHFRKFVSVDSEQAGQPMYLRFWSAAMMSAIIRHTKPDPLIDALVAGHRLIFRDMPCLQEQSFFSLEGLRNT